MSSTLAVCFYVFCILCNAAVTVANAKAQECEAGMEQTSASLLQRTSFDAVLKSHQQDVQEVNAQIQKRTLTACQGDPKTFHTGHGGCAAYVSSSRNFVYCATDEDPSQPGFTAADVCPECEVCQLSYICQGNRETFHTGHGGCAAYVKGSRNHVYCADDEDSNQPGLKAADVCSECETCQAAPEDPATPEPPVDAATPAPPVSTPEPTPDPTDATPVPPVSTPAPTLDPPTQILPNRDTTAPTPAPMPPGTCTCADGTAGGLTGLGCYKGGKPCKATPKPPPAPAAGGSSTSL